MSRGKEKKSESTLAKSLKLPGFLHARFLLPACRLQSRAAWPGTGEEGCPGGSVVPEEPGLGSLGW